MTALLDALRVGIAAGICSAFVVAIAALVGWGIPSQMLTIREHSQDPDWYLTPGHDVTP